MPTQIKAGYKLTDDDVVELIELIKKRDDFIALYQQMEKEKNQIIADTHTYVSSILSSLRAPISGYIRQVGNADGMYADCWIGGELKLSLEPKRPVHSLIVRGWVPDHGSNDFIVSAKVDDKPVQEKKVNPGPFEHRLQLDSVREKIFALVLASNKTLKRSAAGDSTDDRELSFLLTDIEAQH